MADDVLELTKKCAEAMGFIICARDMLDQDGFVPRVVYVSNPYRRYDPFLDAAQAFELLCKFKLHISPPDEQDGRWEAYTLRDPLDPDSGVTAHALDESLNIAIMKCIVELQDGR